MAVLLLPKILHGTVFFVCLIKTCLYTGPGLNATAKEFVPSDLKGISTKLYPLDFYLGTVYLRCSYKHYKHGWPQADKLINISYSTVNFFKKDALSHESLLEDFLYLRTGIQEVSY